MTTATKNRHLNPRSLTLHELVWALRAEARGVEGLEQAIKLVCSDKAYFNNDAILAFIKVDVSLEGDPIAWINWGQVLSALDTGTLDVPLATAAVWRVAAHLACGIPVDIDTALSDMDVYTASLAYRLLLGESA